VNATILGALGTGVLVFLSSLLVPVISKRLNKATDAAHNAETTASSAEKISGSALKIVERLEKDCARCDERLTLTKGALESLIQVNRNIIHLLPADNEYTDDLAATLEAAQRTLWD
jgi:hypothetical protein